MKSRINVGRNNYVSGLAAYAKTIPLQKFTGIRYNFRLNSIQFLLRGTKKICSFTQKFTQIGSNFPATLTFTHGIFIDIVIYEKLSE